VLIGGHIVLLNRRTNVVVDIFSKFASFGFRAAQLSARKLQNTPTICFRSL